MAKNALEIAYGRLESRPCGDGGDWGGGGGGDCGACGACAALKMGDKQTRSRDTTITKHTCLERMMIRLGAMAVYPSRSSAYIAP